MSAEGLIPAATDEFGDAWTPQQDSATSPTAAHTKNWLIAHGVNVLELPSVFDNVRVTNNVWGMLVRLVYKNGAAYETVEQLTENIFKSWYDIDLSFIQNLYDSIPRLFIAVIEKKRFNRILNA